MKIVNTGSTYMIYSDDLKTFDKLPVGTYEVDFSMMQGFFLTRKEDVVLTEKIYGVHESKANKILTSFKHTDRNLGVILSGNKGIGKSLTAKLLAKKAIEQGLPVIMVNTGYKGIASYLSDIKQEVVVLFDEFDKTFKTGSNGRRGEPGDGGAQDEFLTLFDGLDQGKKLFVVTCNSLSDLSDFLVNRPGRFHYHLRFNYPTVEEIKEYLTDKLDVKYHNQIEEVVKFSNMTDLNYDCLRAIAFELNLGTSFKEAIKDLNITSYDNDSKYDVICVLSNGMRSTRKNYYIDLNRDEARMSFSFPSLKDYVDVEFDPSMARWDHQEVCDVCGEDSFMEVRWGYGLSTNKIINTDNDYYDADNYVEDDDEPCEPCESCEECEESEEKTEDTRQARPRVVGVIFKRKSNYRNIHYSI